jgi:hypothetical protein
MRWDWVGCEGGFNVRGKLSDVLVGHCRVELIEDMLEKLRKILKQLPGIDLRVVDRVHDLVC